MGLKYAFNPKPEKSAKAYGLGLRISTKSSAQVCKAVKGKNLAKGKRLMENLLVKKESLDGKHYTNVAKEMLNLLKSAETNAEFKGLDTEKLVIHASAHRGFTMFRPRRFKMRGEHKKITNLQVVLVQK